MLVLLVVFVSSLWVYFDAKSIGVKKGDVEGMANMGPAGWFWVCLLLWIIGFPMYLIKRAELKRAAEQRQAKASPVPNATPTAASASYIQELEKLAELRAKGVLTESEFADRKKALLSAQT